MFFSAHLFDSSPLAAIKRRAPTPEDTPGLRSAQTAICAPFANSMRPSVQLGRESMIACWDDESSVDRFLEDNPTGREAAQGWHVRLELVRSLGVFPGLDDNMSEIAGDKAQGMKGPSFAITMGTAYVKTIPTFYRVNKGLERQFLATPSGLWGTAMSNLRTRFVATLTAWESLDAATAYVKAGAHGEAVRNHFDPKKDLTGHTFVTGGGFFGFRPLSIHGEVTGKNAVSDSLLAA